MRDWEATIRRFFTLGALASIAVVGIAGCGQGPGEAGGEELASAREALLKWASSGTETDASPAFGAQFGRTVSTSGNRIAVTRQAISAADPATTQIWLHGASGWTREFSWPTPVGRAPVAVISPNWFFVGEPCVSSTSGCTGRIYGFLFIGNAWHEWLQIDMPSNPWDFGKAVAWTEGNGFLAVSGGSVVNIYNLSPQAFLPIDTLSEPATPYGGTGFGSSVAMISNGYAVGAPTGTRRIGKNLIHSPGFVYLFGAGVTTLTGVGTEGIISGPAFGASLSASVDGKALAVGAPAEVGRQLSAYVFRVGATGAWSLSNVIAPPSGATGTAISVAIDGSLAVTTDAPGSTTQGTLRLFELPAHPFGPTLDATFTLDGSWAPVDLRAGRAVVGQPNFLGDVGYLATYAGSNLVLEQATLSP
jgi:hypothetical protein